MLKAYHCLCVSWNSRLPSIVGRGQSSDSVLCHCASNRFERRLGRSELDVIHGEAPSGQTDPPRAGGEPVLTAEDEELHVSSCNYRLHGDGRTIGWHDPILGMPLACSGYSTLAFGSQIGSSNREYGYSPIHSVSVYSTSWFHRCLLCTQLAINSMEDKWVAAYQR